GHPRKGLMLIQEDAVDSVQSTKKAADKGQFDLFASFGGDDGESVSSFAIEIPEESWDRKHELALERQMLGLYVSGHPLDGFEDALAAQTVTALTTVVAGEMRNGQELVIGGLFPADDRRVSKRDGSPSAIRTIEDHHRHQQEILVFNQVYSLVAPEIVEDNIIFAKVQVRVRDDRTSFFCNDIRVPELGPGNGAGLPLRLSMRTDQCTMENIAKLKQVLVNN